MQDEVTPVSGEFKNGYGGRGATLVDTLDTLVIMRLDEEFNAALNAVRKIDFTTSADTTLNVFETTIRYLGGLLAAYDLAYHTSKTKHHVLLDKATELGNMLLGAFDTPNRMPITHWDWSKCAFFPLPLIDITKKNLLVVLWVGDKRQINEHSLLSSAH